MSVMQQQLQQALAQQLRGIHLPEAINWWPLAPGWWLLLSVALALTVWAIYKLRQRQQNQLYRKQALSELEALFERWQEDTKTSLYLHKANAILKRCVQHISPETNLSSKTGQPWIDALNQYMDVPLTQQAQHALTVANYQPNPSVDIYQLHQLLCNWVELHRLPNIAKEPNKNDTF